MSTAKQRRANRQAVADVLAMYGAKPYPEYGGGPDAWLLTTPHGPLTVSVWPDHDCNAIFMRWLGGAPPIAWEANSHSGKWNIHAKTASEALAQLRRRLERVGCKVAA